MGPILSSYPRNSACLSYLHFPLSADPCPFGRAVNSPARLPFTHLFCLLPRSFPANPETPLAFPFCTYLCLQLLAHQHGLHNGLGELAVQLLNGVYNAAVAADVRSHQIVQPIHHTGPIAVQLIRVLSRAAAREGKAGSSTINHELYMPFESSYLPHYIHAVVIADLGSLLFRVAIAAGTVVHLEQMLLAGIRHLAGIELICLAEHLGTLEQCVHEDVGGVQRLHQTRFNLFGYLGEGLHRIEVVLQAINIILVQFAIVVVADVHGLVIGDREQLHEELVQRILQPSLAIQHAGTLAITVVRRVLQVAKRKWEKQY